MATEIRVYATEGWSEETIVYLETNSNQPITANYQFKDIQDVKANRGNYTYNFRIPSTTNNNLFFNNYFDVTSFGNYNPRRKVAAEIIVDTYQVFSGYLQLTNVISSDGNISAYQCVIFNSISSFGQVIDSKFLKDYDWSYYDHTITIQNIATSMNRDASGGFKDGDLVYSLFDYGAGFLGTTPAYQGINNFTTAINIRNLKPQMRLKTIWDKIFDDVGFTYKSTFIDAEFPEIYMDLNNGRAVASQGEEDYYITQVAGNQAQTFIAGTGVEEFLNLTDTSFDGYANEAGQFDVATSIFTPQNVYTSVAISVLIRLENTSGSFSSLDVYRLQIVQETILNSGNFNNPVLISSNFPGTMNGDFYWDTGAINLDTTKRYRLRIVQVIGGSAATNSDTILVSTLNWNFYPQASNGQASFELYGNPNNYDASVQFETKHNFGKIKSIDFITSLCKKFNLVIIPDDLILTHLHIEPYSDWIEQGNNVDWSDKLDKSKDIQYKPTANLQAKVMKFQDGESKDLWNSWYLRQSGDRYGTKVLQQENDFGKKTDQIETIFAPTISRYIPDTTIVNTICFGADQEPVEGHRLSYYCGYVEAVNQGTWYLTDGDTTNAYTFYGLLQNYKDAVPTNESECLSFQAMPSGVAPITNNGAYTLYWERFTNETYADDSRLMIANFHLTAVDIHNMNFNDIIFVNDIYYRINKITNYPLVGEGTCKVELIKVLETNSCGVEIKYISTNGSVYFTDTFDGSVVLPNQVSEECCLSFDNAEYVNGKCFIFTQMFLKMPPTNSSFGMNVIQGGNNGAIGGMNSVFGNTNSVTTLNKVTGSYNRIGSTSGRASILGDNNTIGDDSINVSIKGSNNKVEPYSVSSTDPRLKLQSYASYNNVNMIGDYGTPIASGDNVISGGADYLYNKAGRSSSGHFVQTGWTDGEEQITIGQKGNFILGATSETYYTSVIANAFRMDYPSMLGFEMIVVGNNRGTSSDRSQLSSYRKYTGVIHNTNNSGNISAKQVSLDVQKESSEFANYSIIISAVISSFQDSKYIADGMFYFTLETNGATKLDNVDWTIDFKYSLVGLQNLSRTSGQKVFVPTSITGCLLWLDSADYSTFTFDSGTDIQQWDDKSGNNHHCANVINGSFATYNDVIYDPYVQFGATNVALINQDSSLYDYSDSDNTIFVVFKADTSSSGGTYGHHIAGDSYRGRQTNGIFGEATSTLGGGGVGFIGYTNNNSDRSCDSNNLAPTTKQVVCGTYDGSTDVKFYNQNGLQNSKTTGITTATQDQFAVGGSKQNATTVADEFDGKIYEVIVYDTELTDAQREQVFNYLQTKWNT